MKKSILTFLLFIYAISTGYSQTISAIKFEGLKKTKTSYLQRFISQKVGIKYDSIILKNDIQNLRNLNIFYELKCSTSITPTAVIITYEVKEVITLLPITFFGGIKGNFWFTLGLQDVNFRGRGIRFGCFYRYYDRHSFQMFIKNKYIKGSHWGYEVNLAHLSTVEPLYFNDGASNYNYDNTIFEGLGSYEIFRNGFVRLGGAYLYEKYEKIVFENQVISPGPNKHYTEKALFKTGFSMKRVNYNGPYLTGFINDFFIESIRSQFPEENFIKTNNEIKFYKKILGKGNFATRLRTGIATNRPGPFAPFVLDSYVNIRGIGNKINRGTAELAVNIEYRHILFENKLCYIQSVGFIDGGSWRPPGAKLNSMIKQDNIEVLTGLGLRFHFRLLYNSIFRIDYGISVKDKNTKGIVFGLGQYF